MKKNKGKNILKFIKILNLKQGEVESWHGTELTSFLGKIQCDHRYWKVLITQTIEVEIPRGRIGLNYLSKFVCTKWAV